MSLLKSTGTLHLRQTISVYCEQNIPYKINFVYPFLSQQGITSLSKKHQKMIKLGVDNVKAVLHANYIAQLPH